MGTFGIISRFFFEKSKLCIRRLTTKLSRNKLKKYKNIHEGERCFIIATGPSLTIEDCEKLVNEYTFSCNSIIGYFEKTLWKPSYYGILDLNVYNKMDIQKIRQLPCVFYNSIFHYKGENGNAILTDVSYHSFHFTKFAHNYPERFPWTKFSEDISKVIYDGRTVVYALIQIACYMGFKEIYLLGCDTNYDKNNLYSKDLDYGNDFNPNLQHAAEAMIECYKVAKKYCDENKIKIFNATRGGMLEVFPRVDFDTIV